MVEFNDIKVGDYIAAKYSTLDCWLVLRSYFVFLLLDCHVNINRFLLNSFFQKKDIFHIIECNSLLFKEKRYILRNGD